MALPGAMEMMLILGVVTLLFGAKKLPELGGAMGATIRNFKRSVREDEPPPRPKLELVSGTRDEPERHEEGA